MGLGQGHGPGPGQAQDQAAHQIPQEQGLLPEGLGPQRQQGIGRVPPPREHVGGSLGRPVQPCSYYPQENRRLESTPHFTPLKLPILWVALAGFGSSGAVW